MPATGSESGNREECNAAKCRIFSSLCLVTDVQRIAA